MNNNIINNNDKYMTVKELSEVFQCHPDTIKYNIKKLFPDKLQKGKTTILNEIEVTAIKLEMDKSLNLRNVSYVPKSDLEKTLLIEQGKMLEKIRVYEEENAVLKSKNECLVKDNLRLERIAISNGVERWILLHSMKVDTITIDRSNRNLICRADDLYDKYKEDHYYIKLSYGEFVQEIRKLGYSMTRRSYRDGLRYIDFIYGIEMCFNKIQKSLVSAGIEINY